VRRLLVTAGLALLAVAATAAALEARSAASLDFGDAPDGVKAGYAERPDLVARFPSKAASGGPRHGAAGPRLGGRWSAEGDSRQVDRDADDGAAVTPRACAVSTLEVVVDLGRVPEETPVYVNAWFDWNRDGDWADAGNARCGPEWGVQNHRIDRATLRGAAVDVVTIRFRAGALPKEFWWRVQVHVGAPATHDAGAGAATAGGETEDSLFSALETAPDLRLRCRPGVVQHGKIKGLWPEFAWSLVAPPGLGARLKVSHVRALGPTDGLKVFWATHADFVDVQIQTKEHVREPVIQMIHVEVTSRADWPGGTGVARGACPIVIRHAPRIPSETSHQGNLGAARVSVAVDPVRPDPAKAGCRADFVRDGLRAEISARCDGVSPKLLTVAPGTGVIATLRGNPGLGSCGWSPDRRALSCLYPRNARTRVGNLDVVVDRPFVRMTIYITAGGYNERGTTHVLRQDWWLRPDGVYLCSQTIPRAERQRCATIGTSPRTVDGEP